jgi:hypothetical protein
MKILSIGNSFSQDPHAHLHELAAQNGLDIYAVNLYISACSLRTHAVCLANGSDAYELEINGASTGRKISIAAALAMEDWDVITLQQVSHLTGIPSSYFPHFGQLYHAVKAACPRAQIWFQHTWAYAADSNHPLYKLYNRDQQTMLRRAEACKDMVVRIWNTPVIPTGDVIQRLRPIVGEERLHRDTFHLSLDYGRLAAAAVWIKTLTGRNLIKQPYRDFDRSLTDAIFDEVNKL